MLIATIGKKEKNMVTFRLKTTIGFGRHFVINKDGNICGKIQIDYTPGIKLFGVDFTQRELSEIQRVYSEWTPYSYQSLRGRI